MQTKARTPEETYRPALARAHAALSSAIPQEMAVRAGVSYQALDIERGHFEVPYFGALYAVSWPGGRIHRSATGLQPDITTRIILLHYLLTADGTPTVSEWIAFRNLPGGMGYDTAFQGRSSRRLAQAFGTDLPAFCQAAGSLGGESLTYGDASFMFRLLPRVWLAVVLHLADDEFPANASVLFDAAAGHYLPTEDLAVLGGVLCGKLVRKARGR